MSKISVGDLPTEVFFRTEFSFCIYIQRTHGVVAHQPFFSLRWLASATDEKSVQVSHRRAFFFSLMKRSKNQGLDLMSD